MEDNIADALKMAGSVLLFVLGLSICMLAFSQARVALDTVLSYSDRESLTVEKDPRYYYLAGNDKTNRYVGKETIIPAIYRAYKENYKIIFENMPDDYYLFSKKVKNEITNVTETVYVKKIDLQEQNIGSDYDSRVFLNGILYRDFTGISDQNNNGIPNEKSDYELKYSVNLNPNYSLYEFLENNKSKSIKESLGTYYQEDLLSAEQRRQKRFDNKDIKSTEVSEVNKTEKRVITYTFE